MERTEEKQKKPKKRQNYLLVFFALAALTVMEILVTQFPLPHAPILISLSVIKAALVALFYMHLRTDHRVFSAFFGLGILLGIAMLVSFVILINTSIGNNH